MAKVYLIETGKGLTSRLHKVPFDPKSFNYVFIGRSSELSYRIDKLLASCCPRIEIAEQMGEIQYKYVEQYYDFIDNYEEKSGNEWWWASRLSWKNPWISLFFLRVCQLELMRQLTYDVPEHNSLVIFIEDRSILKAFLDSTRTERQFELIVQKANRLNDRLKLLYKGYTRRIGALPKYLIDRKKLKKKFSKLSPEAQFNSCKSLIVVPTFIDERSFRNGRYSDPFLGKILESVKLNKSQELVIVPIVFRANFPEQELFRIWLEKRSFHVFFLPQVVSLFNLIHLCIKGIFAGTRPTSKSKFLNHEVEPIIRQERREEWSEFNGQDQFLRELAKRIGSLNVEKLILYPFENQAWERILVYEMNKYGTSYMIGNQNAPCPVLSTRFFFSKEKVNKLPLPDTIIANGELSFQLLYARYSKRTTVLKGGTSRPIQVENKQSNRTNTIKRIMVGCSLGELESRQLISFVCRAMNDIKNAEAYIVPHPLAKSDYAALLNFFDKPENVYLSTIGFNSELEIADYVLFDSSTVGLQAMKYNIVPIFVGHEMSIHVNPNDFDKEITRYVYKIDDLRRVIESRHTFINERGEKVSSSYFGDGSGVNTMELFQNSINKLAEPV